jgi:1,4-dihydroxy-2-naphthoyl-CoA hydrolase
MSRIWHDPHFKLDHLIKPERHSMSEHLGIEITEIGDDYIAGRMPVDHRTKQVFGILHGGASVALAETLGSMASHFVIDQRHYAAVGMEVNANHLRSVSRGYVTGLCTPVHLGRKTHVWDIRISDEAGKISCISRLTVAIIEKR